jgi:hypothetical protein
VRGLLRIEYLAEVLEKSDGTHHQSPGNAEGAVHGAVDDLNIVHMQAATHCLRTTAP